MIETNLENKVIVIAGATGGIGSGVAKRLDKSGAVIFLIGRNEDKLISLQNELNGQTYIYQQDFNEIENLKNVFFYVKEKGYKADGMIYTAGVCADIPIKSVSYEEMQRNMQINYYAFVELSKNFANRRYSNEGASIVGMSSIASIMCEKAMSQYAASKAALNASVSTMSKEFASRKIRVNALAPAFVDTEMAWGTAQSRSDFEDYLNSRMPYGVIPVDEVAAWAEFLLSDISGHITGEVIKISGGMY